MIPVELDLILKATLLLSCGLAATGALRRAAASSRHLVLASSLAAVCVLPVIAAFGPDLVVQVPVAERQESLRQGVAAPGTSAQPVAIPAPPAPNLGVTQFAGLSPIGILKSIWVAGTLTVLTVLGIGLWRLRRLRVTAIPLVSLQDLADGIAVDLGVRRRVAVVTHDRVVAPLTFGVLNVTVMLPGDVECWPAAAARRALVHEIEHVRRFDWVFVLLARTVGAVLWFIPLAWIAERRLRLEAERACDDAVVAGSDNADYADQLVALARRFRSDDPIVMLGMANRSELSVRVRSLLDDRQQRGRVRPAASFLIASLGLLLLASVGGLTVTEAADGDGPAVVVSTASQQSRGRGERSLYRAAERGDVTRMTELIDDGADVNRAFDGDGTPLIAAARAGKTAAVKLLLDRGADPNLAVPGDGNPLIMAARDGHRDVVALLLDRGARINEVVPEDENALMQASAAGELEVVQLLISRGADVNIRAWTGAALERPNGEWRTALGMARRNRHDVVAKVLIAAGARE